MRRRAYSAARASGRLRWPRVKVNAEPKPLREPLAGRHEGATVVVEPLDGGRGPLARTRSSSAPAGRSRACAPIGVGSSPDSWECASRARLPGPPSERRADPGRHRPSPLDRAGTRATTSAASAPGHYAAIEAGRGRRRPSSAAAGSSPADIAVVVMTHLHFDHASAIVGVPGAPRSCSARPSGRRRRPARGRCCAATARPTTTTPSTTARSTSTRDGIDSYATFGRTFDLFGDGSVRLAYTPGHSAGHTSVICRLPRPRLRDRRRRHLHHWRQLEGGAGAAAAASTSTTGAARCGSCRLFRAHLSARR